MFCLIKKLIRHGMKRIQSKLLELEPMMLLKFLCVLLMIKDDGINSLAYFHKDIRSQQN